MEVVGGRSRVRFEFTAGERASFELSCGRFVQRRKRYRSFAVAFGRIRFPITSS